jgi:dinuclear metal center YbgI/SA1388 family protein
MGCPRETILSALEKLAPLRFAESWDNVGLLVDPGKRVEFERALITVDLTDLVLEEALTLGADFIIAYHPPIFAGLQRLRFSVARERVVLRAVREGLTIYSPHTALDAVPGGMGEWLARAVGPGRITPIVPHPTEAQAGAGRMVRLDRPVSIERAVTMVKAHLQLPQLRLSTAEQLGPLTTVAFCPGAGGSVFERVAHADLFITGELRHHDIVDRTARGSCVILTDHTNTERGYMQHLAQDVVRRCPGLAVSVSGADRDPLVIV